MSTTSALPAIVTKVTVNVPIERAFEIFTASFGTWWPAGNHIGSADLADAVIEPRAGGRWYERGVDGSECDWGRVLEWEPPHRILLTWQISGEWRYDPDESRASEVEVRFMADGPRQTTVELQHRHLERMVAGDRAHAAVGSTGGWPDILAGYAAAVAASETD
jgi:uncharacterized protein YndB with AHSA1/START domain